MGSMATDNKTIILVYHSLGSVPITYLVSSTVSKMQQFSNKLAKEWQSWTRITFNFFYCDRFCSCGRHVICNVLYSLWYILRWCICCTRVSLFFASIRNNWLFCILFNICRGSNLLPFWRTLILMNMIIISLGRQCRMQI